MKLGKKDDLMPRQNNTHAIGTLLACGLIYERQAEILPFHFGLQSRFGDKSVMFSVICARNGTAVLLIKGLETNDPDANAILIFTAVVCTNSILYLVYTTRYVVSYLVVILIVPPCSAQYSLPSN